FVLFRFFFQAEDGIRDRNVTGVQTCALPILSHMMDCTLILDRISFRIMPRQFNGFIIQFMDNNKMKREADYSQLLVLYNYDLFRSEERRVGKECRYRGLAEHCSKKSDEMRRR